MEKNPCRALVLYRQPTATAEYPAEAAIRDANIGVWNYRYFTNWDAPSRSRGERSCNLDYFYFHTLAVVSVAIITYYDVGCQWQRARIDGFYHTDGEGIETAWAAANPHTGDWSKMGPGARHDTLDYVFRRRKL
ncbi:hypothetical protein B0H11DRAFT_2229609 [Mycena galericulata]|nr:hypothetical protein B0H11DRAFT_2229609 [Mycena galericulata]